MESHLGTRLEDRCRCVDELTEFCQMQVLSGRCGFPQLNPEMQELLRYGRVLRLHRMCSIEALACCIAAGVAQGPGLLAKLLQFSGAGLVNFQPQQHMGAEAPPRRFSSEFVDGDLPSLKRRR